MLKGFFGLILTGLLFFSSLGFVVFRLGSADFIVEQAREVSLYGRLINNIEPLLGFREGNKPPLLEGEELSEVVRSAVDGEQFYDFLGRYLKAHLEWLTGERETLNFSDDVTAVKQKASNELAAKVLAKYEGLPSCQANQLKTWSLDEGLPECKLSEGSASSRQDIATQIRSLANEQISGIPNRIVSNNPSTNMHSTRENLGRILTLIKLLWLLTGALVILFFIISRRGAFFTLAGAFLLVGVIEVGFSLIAWDWLAKNIADFVSSGEAAVLAPLIVDFASTILEVFQTALGSISIVFLIAGASMLAAGFIWRPKPSILPK